MAETRKCLFIGGPANGKVFAVIQDGCSWLVIEEGRKQYQYVRQLMLIRCAYYEVFVNGDVPNDLRDIYSMLVDAEIKPIGYVEREA